VILKSWKEIASYLHCGVRTAQRWENELGLPVQRPAGPDRNVVLAFSEELDQWVSSGTVTVVQDARENISRQGELRQELRELRSRQHQLVAELREQIKQSKTKKTKRSTRTKSKDQSIRNATLEKTNRPTSVMTVDDNASQCYTISQILRHAGYKVFEANSVTEALETAEREAPAVTLLDVHLQDLTGYELFGLLRNNPHTKDIAAIFYTAFSPPDAASLVAQLLGAAGFLKSPIEPKALVALVQNTIANLEVAPMAGLAALNH
jgi:CheY-like chemotaxis protein